MRRYISVLALVGLFLGLFTACAPKAQTHLDKIKSAGKLIVGTSADYPPFEFTDANGAYTGFDIDLVNKIGEQLGVSVEIQDMPFDSLVAAVESGKIDMSAAAFNYEADRDKQVDFTDPYFEQGSGVISTDQFTGAITKIEDLGNYKVGVQTGTTQDTWITDNLVKKGLMKEENLARYERVDQGTLDVTSGRIDLFLADYVPAADIVKNTSGLKIAFHSPVASGPVMLIVPNNDAALKDAVNAAIKKLKEDGTIEQLNQKYITGQ